MNNKLGAIFPVRSLIRFGPRGFFFATIATVVLSGCGSGGGGGGQTTTVTDTSIIASEVVTSAGGVVSDGSENTLVVIPPGAVTENTTITIRKGVAADGYPVTTFESSVPTGPVRIILPDPDSPSVGGVSGVAGKLVAGKLTMPIAQGADTKFACGNDRSKDWYRRCAWFWKPNKFKNGVPIAGVGNRLPDRVVDMKLSPELKKAGLRQAALLASECKFSDSSCYVGKEPVLFVHGYLLTPELFSENGFGGGGGTYDDFPQQLKLSISTKAITLFEFRWVTAAKFEDVAQDLGIAIDQIAARTGRKVHVVAHSFGGVLMRTYLQGLAAGGYPYSGNVASLTTLGSPHSGLFDDVTPAINGTVYQRGTHSGVGTTQTNACKQLSCYQAGEPIDFGEESYFGAENLDHKQVLSVELEPGEITVRLFETRDQLPDVPIQVLIGLAADKDASIFGDSVDVKDGDCLISYAGQRFAPDLMTAATLGQQLVNDRQIGNARVTEHILGFSDDTRPGTTIPVLSNDPERYGYRHANTEMFGVDLLPGCRGDSLEMVMVDSTNASYHEGLISTRTWIAKTPSPPSTAPVNIQVTGRIVDKQTGAGPGVPGTVFLRPWLAIGQADVHGNFSIEVNQVMPVDNIEIVATVTGYQQGFQTAIGAGSGGLVSLPDLGLIKTGSATVSPVVMQKLAKLEVVSAGDGNGNVSGQGIGCPSKCSVWLGSGSTVALRAAAWRDSQFSGWSGCTRVTGVNGETCETVVGASGSVVTATFTKLALLLPSEPLTPSTPIATALSQSNIAFTWQDNSDSESGFEVERKLGVSGAYTRIAQLRLSSGTGSSIYFEDTGLVAGTQYCYRARALNAGGYSSYTSEVCATTQAVGTGIPPDTVIDSNPPASTPSTSATFTFHSTPSGGTFECKLDSGSYVACSSPLSYSNLAIGPHTFLVRATNAAGTDASPASSSWTIGSSSLSQWTQIAGLEGGQVRSLAVDPATLGTLYAGTLGGVFKSTNGGATWSAVNTGLTNWNVSTLAMDPATPGTLYAGTYGGGVFKSTNGGAMWGAVNTSLTTLDVYTLAVDLATPGTLYAGTWSGGVFKSTNGGATWGVVNTGLTALYVYTLAVDLATPGTLYAGTYGGGVFKSANGGATWSAVNTGLMALGVRTLAVDPTTPGTLYAGTYGGGGVFKSTNGGATWGAVNTGLTDLYVSTLAMDPATPGTLYAGTYGGGGVFKSTNGGATWGAVNTGLTALGAFALAVDPATPGTLYAGTNGGVFKSTDGGATWSAVNTGLTILNVRTLAVDPATPGTLYAGTDGGVFHSTNDATTWGAVNTGLTTLYVDTLAVDPATPGTLYAGTHGGVFKSTNDGATWGAVNTGLTALGVFTLAVDPATPGTLYAGTYGGVFKSANGGATWGAVNTGLTILNVYTLAMDPATPGTLYAGTYGGGVFKSTDGGATWSAVNTGLTILNVRTLAVDPATPGTLYAGTDGGVFHSTNDATTWGAVNTGLTTLYVDTLAVDPATPGTLYAGTNGGVFKSTNDGATWGAVNTGLTTLYVYTLAVDPATPGTLYAGTYGGGVFKSTNGGAMWSAVNTGLTILNVRTLAVDPATPGTLYAGTWSGGVFKSANGGATWGAVNTGLTDLNVYTLAVDPATPSTLYAGTGGGVFKGEAAR